MKWPTHYLIFSCVWEIEYVSRLKDIDSDDPEDPDNDLLGCTRADLRKIWISLDQVHDSIRDTVWHELVHACYSTASMSGERESAIDREENIVLFSTMAAREIIGNATSDWYR